MHSIETHGQHVFRAEFYVGGEVHPKRIIAVRPSADVLAVEPNFGVGHCTVEIDEDSFALFGGRHVEVLSIPTDAFPRKLAGVTGEIAAEWPFDAPIMWNVQLPPR